MAKEKKRITIKDLPKNKKISKRRDEKGIWWILHRSAGI